MSLNVTRLFARRIIVPIRVITSKIRMWRDLDVVFRLSHHPRRLYHPLI